jgi:hypothetical protein
MALNRDLLHVTAINRRHELAENDFRFAAVLFIKDTKDREENQCQN